VCISFKKNLYQEENLDKGAVDWTGYCNLKIWLSLELSVTQT